MTGEIWGILAGVLLTVGTGLFVASEFALVSLDRPELEQRRNRGEKRLGPTISALKITSTHLSAAQLGITLTTLLAGYTFEPAITSLMSGPLLGLGVPASAVAGVGAVVSIVIATLFSMILGELIPKNFALAVPLATAKLVIPFQIAFTWVFRPIVALLNGTANRLIRAMGIEPKEELSGARTAEELSFLVRRSALEGALDHDDAAMLHRTLVFSSHTAEEVMTPRVLAEMLPRTATAADVVRLAAETGYSRFPVVGDSVDDILGVVHVKSAYAIDFERREFTPVTDCMSEAIRVPETAGVGSMLEVLRRRGFQFAVVVDEYGGTAGVVTLEDLVEELLGEVHDEHDEPEDEIIRSDNSILFSASLRPDELFDRTRIRVPESEEYETVAGYVFDVLERIPDLGEEIPLTHGRLRVDSIDGSRITRVQYLSDDPASDPVFGSTRDGMMDAFEQGAER
ncbi:CBS domain containing-hemolysin-like protein [Leucobacter exalbidus]|uniref:CBS domain containing-hemolysin-like protein n=1 Tax=Leucobacter exalbidus TaxID=662960 RepID=A0A940T6B2_9MICO|nr:hemolysin family protein [Leucobacter exalbidus]MBP1326821.1 CBS domain containing-hemolysin-like protein [Leucobacter exalbidus]